MTDQQILYDLPADDRDAAGLAGAVAALPDDERDKILHMVASAVVTFECDGDEAALGQFARDLAATVRLRRNPAYREAAAKAPTRSSGTGRPIDEIFAEHRR